MTQERVPFDEIGGWLYRNYWEISNVCTRPPYRNERQHWRKEAKALLTCLITPSMYGIRGMNHARYVFRAYISRSALR